MSLALINDRNKNSFSSSQMIQDITADVGSFFCATQINQYLNSPKSISLLDQISRSVFSNREQVLLPIPLFALTVACIPLEAITRKLFAGNMPDTMKTKWLKTVLKVAVFATCIYAMSRALGYSADFASFMYFFIIRLVLETGLEMLASSRNQQTFPQPLDERLNLKKIEYANFSKEVYDCLKSELTPIKQKTIEIFLQKRGVINLVKPENVINVSKNDQHIVGCTFGQNRSQALGAFLKEKGCNVKEIIAGSSGVNPWVDFHDISLRQDENFAKVFSFERMNQLGSNLVQEDDDKTEISAFYTDFFKKLDPTHFLCFGTSGGSVIEQLVNLQKDLEGFKLTYLTWDDTIQHPGDGIKAKSIEAYEAFKQKLENAIIFDGST